MTVTAGAHQGKEKGGPQFRAACNLIRQSLLPSVPSPSPQLQQAGAAGNLARSHRGSPGGGETGPEDRIVLQTVPALGTLPGHPTPSIFNCLTTCLSSVGPKDLRFLREVDT